MQLSPRIKCEGRVILTLVGKANGILWSRRNLIWPKRFHSPGWHTISSFLLECGQDLWLWWMCEYHRTTIRLHYVVKEKGFYRCNCGPKSVEFKLVKREVIRGGTHSSADLEKVSCLEFFSRNEADAANNHRSLAGAPQPQRGPQPQLLPWLQLWDTLSRGPN